MRLLSSRSLILAFVFLFGFGGCLDGQEKMSSEKEPQHAHTNKLIGETSPYLLQHAHNPVHWYPWGTEAFDLAKQQNKPIFLSVGYSTCYWCHVMERESFERDDVAAILNQHYIAIKVDREERPELDQQFMVATQLVSRGRGGWPNSVWLTPDGKPWMAGTYFPRQQFKDVLLQLADVWKTKKTLVLKQANAITNAIAEMEGDQADPKPISNDLIQATVKAAASRFDAQRGGFGPAPKFPPHDMLAVLIDQYRRTQDKEVLEMLNTTLREMAYGGVYDQLGGGFHRYSTDDRWLLPHFEKMLYDNGQLMRAYTDGYLLTKNEMYRETVDGIYSWLKREMTSPQGGFYSAIDSESDAEEGKFYVWNYAEILELLGKKDGQLFAEIYNVSANGNFHDEATKKQSTNNILHINRSLAEEAKSRNLDPSSLNQRLALMRSKLLQSRDKREYPHLDDKVIAAWNGLMIEALAYAGRKLDEPKYVDAAKHAADFILDSMIKEGRLKRTSRGDQAKIDGYLNDYAFMAKGLLELHHATSHQGESGEPYLDAATSMAETLLRDFQDPNDGGFFFTEDKADTSPDENPLGGIVIRSKNLSSGGNLPSGNGVAAEVLLELSDLLALTGSNNANRYREAAKKTLAAMSGHLHQQSGNADHLLLALARLNEPKDGSNFSGSVIQGRLDPPVANASPGQIVTMSIRLKIDEGWHLYGQNPDSPFLKPTAVAFESHPQLEVVSISTPAGIKKTIPALGQTLMIYEDEVTFEVALKISQAATPGLLQLSGTLSCQACDENKCIAPESIPIAVSVMITDEAE